MFSFGEYFDKFIGPDWTACGSGPFLHLGIPGCGSGPLLTSRYRACVAVLMEM